MQEMQHINQTLQPTADDTDKGDELQQTQKRKSGTVCSTSTVTCPEQLPSTSVAADVRITSPTDDTYKGVDEPQQTRKRKSARHSTSTVTCSEQLRSASSTADVPITRSVDITEEQEPQEVLRKMPKKSRKTKKDKL